MVLSISGDTYLFCFTCTCTQIPLHSVDFAGDKNVTFDFSDACLFGHPVLTIKIMRESHEKCYN